MNRFTVGQRVRSRVTAQGLVRGAEYVVGHVECKHYAFGDFITYTLTLAADADAEPLRVANGHLLLDPVD